MKNGITPRKVVPILTLLCATSFIALLSVFSFTNVLVMHNDDAYKIKTMDYISDAQVLSMIDLSMENAEIYQINQVGNLKTIVVEDTFPVNITVDGEVLTVNTIKNSVSNILKQANVNLGKDDIINVNKTEILQKSTDINVIRVTKNQVFTEETIPYETVKRSTSNLKFGQTSVKTAGQDGVKTVTTEQIMHDGVLVSEQIVNSEITLEATNEIIEYGTFNVNRGVTHRDGLLTTLSGEQVAYSKIIEVTATAYSTENWTSKHTASGTVARVGAIAVDPRVIPLGSKLYITSTDGSWTYGTAVAEDTGGAIKGNKIDLFFNTRDECINFGRKPATVYVLS